MNTSSFFHSLREIRGLTDAELEARIDEQLAGGHMATVTFLRDEIERRESARCDELWPPRAAEPDVWGRRMPQAAAALDQA